MDTRAYSRSELIGEKVPAIEEFSFRAGQGPEVSWTDSFLAKIVRLRLVVRDDEPTYELLYCHGLLKDGRACRVLLPFECLTMPRRQMREYLASVAVRAGLLQNKEVFLSLFPALSTAE